MKFKIFKFDPSVDTEPYYVTHEVPYTDKMTALEALVYVHENCEPIAYDYSCHGRMCGRCAMTLNGTPVFMCSEPLDPNKDYTLEPLKGFNVIRDLIVDKSDFDNRLSAAYTRVRVEPMQGEADYSTFDTSVTDKLYNLEWCSRCGVCMAACPVLAENPDKFAGPSFLIASAYRHYDPYDQADRLLEAVNNGLFLCAQCGRCDAVCPRYDIDHLGTWKDLREQAEARGLKPSYAK